MKKLIRPLLVVAMVLLASPTFAEENRPADSQISPANNIDGFEYPQAVPGETSLAEKAHAANKNGQRSWGAHYKPKHWIEDFNYQSNIESYFQNKYQQGQENNMQTYVYLYADWAKSCVAFRKSVSNKNLAALFKNNQILMIDYNYFKKAYKTRIRHLPLIFKVSQTGILGPEFIYPVAKANDHPRKIFHKLKKFFEH